MSAQTLTVTLTVTETLSPTNGTFPSDGSAFQITNRKTIIIILSIVTGILVIICIIVYIYSQMLKRELRRRGIAGESKDKLHPLRTVDLRPTPYIDEYKSPDFEGTPGVGFMSKVRRIHGPPGIRSASPEAQILKEAMVVQINPELIA
ncbi:hypothetical protein CVT24_011243 [Panaeolus cyanescens]|uniref:Uncharacterized protein n=1 Tax=Panaeolus cyanescens TaxID=181874 RepID=A0A409YGG2_9AGAR|nr:hypothetical protein CVT24_011243 [Panaeolus cyanescens]